MYQAVLLLFWWIFECIKRFCHFVGAPGTGGDRGPETGDGGSETGDRGPDPGDLGPGTKDRAPETWDRGPGTGRRALGGNLLII